MGSINALPNYISYFNLPENGNASTGIVFAIFQVMLLTRYNLGDVNDFPGWPNVWCTIHLDD